MYSGTNLYLKTVLITTAVKLLLIPSYKSTDFEVHRNWLALTSSLPLRQWYIDETSPWTLDYPPFFAWFEFLLGKMAVLFDPEMLRLSVIVMDLVMIGATGFAISRAQLGPEEKIWFFAVVLCNAGLLMVDHVHFQYNGFLIGEAQLPLKVSGLILGVLLWSVLCIEQDQCLMSAILFSVLLNLKHLFLYSAPVYFAYLLRHYCFKNRTNPIFAFCKLGACVILVFAASFGPFIWYGQLGQILTRLFPFGRGLCHAYWAPNVWALYAFIDKILSLYLSSPVQPTTTSGLVGAWRFAVLSEINPALSLILVLIFASLPAILQFCKPRSETFMECVAYANLCGFMWGYHVHEKAILPVLIPLLFVAFRKSEDSVMNHKDHILFFSTLSHYSLTPLLFQSQEYPIKFLLMLTYALLVSLALKNERNLDERHPTSTVEQLEAHGKWILLFTVFCLEFILLGMSCFKIQSRYEFLSLMLTSILSAIGITYYWIRWTYAILLALFKDPEKSKKY